MVNDKIVFEDSQIAYIESPWRNKTKANALCLELSQIILFETKSENADIQIARYTDGKDFTAIRLFIKYGRHIYFILDKIKTKEPTCVFTDFFICNSGNKVSCNVADKHRIVARNGETGMKLFRFENCLDNENEMETAGLILPEGHSKGGEDIKLCFYDGLHNFHKEHSAAYGICVDKEDMVGRWHFKSATNEIFVEPPFKGKGGIKITYAGSLIRIIDQDSAGVILEFDLSLIGDEHEI